MAREEGGQWSVDKQREQETNGLKIKVVETGGGLCVERGSVVLGFCSL